MEIFDVIMQKMKDYGLKVMIDVHSPAEHNSGHNYNLWYYTSAASDGDTMAIGAASGEKITWDMWKDSVTWLAEKYSNDVGQFYRPEQLGIFCDRMRQLYSGCEPQRFDLY